MIEFKKHNDCRACPLYESATNPGVPTRCLHGTSRILGEGNKTAIIFIGEAPGYNEDQQSTCWVGKAGDLLTRFIAASSLKDHADIYLGNICRCRPPQNATPTHGQMNTCREYLQEDFDTLCQNYNKVIIMCCGAAGTFGVTGQTSLSPCFSKQGNSLSYFTALKKRSLEQHRYYIMCTRDPIPVFFTYHPANLLPGRSPSKVVVVQDHFTLLRRYLTGKFIPNSIQVVPEVGKPTPSSIPGAANGLVCVDIETYGILKGVHQSVFHPVKSQYIDHVKLGEQVVTVAFGYTDASAPTGFRTFVYDFHKHIRYIRRWFRLLISSGTSLLGQNIKFDLTYLAANDPVLSRLISPLNLQIQDTLLSSFLLYEQRPEKGLKELAVLFGLADYQGREVRSGGGTAKSPSDPKLLEYNCLDTACTLTLDAYNWEQIKERYGPDSVKFSDTCRDLCNQILWDVILLEQAGCAMSVPTLEGVHNVHSLICETAIEFAKQEGLIISSKGSQKSCREFMMGALTEAGLLNDKRVKLTEKTKEISIGTDNFHLLDNHLTETSPFWGRLQSMKTFRKSSKIVNTYTSKLLGGKADGIIIKKGKTGLTFPTWYPMPAVASHYGDSDDAVGGTIQGRFSCKKPPAQTWPESIKGCIISRFPGGKIVGYDLSQIELRVPALLSGDPAMLAEYHKKKVDLHTQTALLIFPDADPNDPEFSASGHFGQHKRELGKTLNFLMIFRGGAKKFQETALNEYGIFIPLPKCQQIINSVNRRYHILRKWQDGCMKTVRETGYLELPTGWSRSWGKADPTSSEISEICDFPVQTIAAQLLQSAQFAINCEFIRRGLGSLIILNIQDALYLDVFPGEGKIVDEIVDKFLTQPPLMSKIEEATGNSVPITYEKKELSP